MAGTVQSDQFTPLVSTQVSDFTSAAQTAAGSISLGGCISGLAGSMACVCASATGSGTAYTLTDSSAAVTFGTTSPTITIPSTGTYILWANTQLAFNAATFVSAQTVSFKLRRTNNTAADLSGSVQINPLNTFTLATINGPQTAIGPVQYLGTAADTISLFGNLSAITSAGTTTVSAATIFALRVA